MWHCIFHSLIGHQSQSWKSENRLEEKKKKNLEYDGWSSEAVSDDLLDG